MKAMKRITVLFALLASLTASAADLQVKDMLVTMPDSLLTLISASGRQDLIDFYESGVPGWTENRLGGRSHTLYFDTDRLSVATSDAGSFDLFLLSLKGGGSLVGLIKNVRVGNFMDSRISFYTPLWKPVPVKSVIRLPEFDDFLEPSALKNDSVSTLRAMSLVRFVSIEPSAEEPGVLIVTYTSADNLGPDADAYRHFFRQEPLRYVWNGRRFKLRR